MPGSVRLGNDDEVFPAGLVPRVAVKLATHSAPGLVTVGHCRVGDVLNGALHDGEELDDETMVMPRSSMLLLASSPKRLAMCAS